jgi:hypothetical protein
MLKLFFKLIAVCSFAIVVFAPDAANAACRMDKRFKPPLKVCDDPKPLKCPYKPGCGPPKDDAPLVPIVVPNSGAFGTPKPSTPRCPPGQVLSRTGQCRLDTPCPPGQVLSRTGQCRADTPCPPGHTQNRAGRCIQTAQCRPGRVMNSAGQCVPAGPCRPGQVLTRTGQCVRG